MRPRPVRKFITPPKTKRLSLVPVSFVRGLCHTDSNSAESLHAAQLHSFRRTRTLVIHRVFSLDLLVRSITFTSRDTNHIRSNLQRCETLAKLAKRMLRTMKFASARA